MLAARRKPYSLAIFCAMSQVSSSSPNGPNLTISSMIRANGRKPKKGAIYQGLRRTRWSGCR